MTTRLVVAADSTRARFFSMTNLAPQWRELEDLVHPQSRLHARDIVSDRPGRGLDRGGEGRHAMDPATDAHRHEVETFARAVAERIERMRTHNEVDEIVLVAPPRFLGELRAQLSAHAARLVVDEVAKNLVQSSSETLIDTVSQAVTSR